VFSKTAVLFEDIPPNKNEIYKYVYESFCDNDLIRQALAVGCKSFLIVTERMIDIAVVAATIIMSLPSASIDFMSLFLSLLSVFKKFNISCKWKIQNVEFINGILNLLCLNKLMKSIEADGNDIIIVAATTAMSILEMHITTLLMKLMNKNDVNVVEICKHSLCNN
jgi:hypothetical protein